MNMPGFTAETSLYQTSNHYRSDGGSFLSNVNTTVTPQACGIFSTKFWTCALIIGNGITVCSGACAAGPLVCAGCWAVVFGGTLAVDCYECIPGWMRDVIEGGGGDGGSPPRCGRTGSPCGNIGDLPCCSGYYCAIDRCQPEGTDPV